MSSTRTTRPQRAGRRGALRLGANALLAATLLLPLAGCGGGSGAPSTGSSPAPGSYQGVYLATGGQFSPDAGLLTLTISANGLVTGTRTDLTGGRGAQGVSGTVTTTGVVVSTAGNGTLSQDATTHELTMSYTERDQTTGLLSLGPVPASSALAGSYSGTYTSSQGGPGSAALTVGPTGSVTGALSPSGGGTVSLSGSVDATGTLYAAYRAPYYTTNGQPATAIGGLTLSGATLSGTLQESAANGSTGTVTFSLTRH